MSQRLWVLVMLVLLVPKGICLLLCVSVFSLRHAGDRGDISFSELVHVLRTVPIPPLGVVREVASCREKSGCSLLERECLLEVSR